MPSVIRMAAETGTPFPAGNKNMMWLRQGIVFQPDMLVAGPAECRLHVNTSTSVFLMTCDALIHSQRTPQISKTGLKKSIHWMLIAGVLMTVGAGLIVNPGVHKIHRRRSQTQRITHIACQLLPHRARGVLVTITAGESRVPGICRTRRVPGLSVLGEEPEQQEHCTDETQRVAYAGMWLHNELFVTCKPWLSLREQSP